MPSRASSNSRKRAAPTVIRQRRTTRALSSTPKSRQAAAPTWEAGYVNPGREHFELRYGERQIPIARVGRDKSGQVLVQYLMKSRIKTRGTDPWFSKMVNDISSELTYYLFNALGSSAWTFARFHCDTPANIASQVHWRWQSGGKGAL